MNRTRFSNTTVLFGVALVAHALILIEYAWRMWQKSQYQFFPLLFLAVGYLFFTAPKEYRTYTGRPPGILTFVSMAGVFVLLLLATGLNSPFIGIVSFLLLVCTAIGTLFGRESLRHMSRFLWILIFVVPWPLNLNERLTNSMQFWASGLASTFLDALGFIHFREGVVICTTEDRFLTEEACSGVRSLFSALATVALYGYSEKRSWVRQIFNLGQTFFWVVIGNAIRIMIVVIGADYGYTFLANGLGHQLLGFVMYLVIVFLAISTDKIFSNFGADRVVEDSVSPVKVERASDAQLNPQSARCFLAADWSVCRDYLFGNPVGGFTQTLCNGHDVGYDVFRSARGIRFAGRARRLERLKEYSLDHRGEDSLFAAYSYIWIYEKGNLSATLSLDCPYPAWHNLNVCYTGIGWDCQLDHFFGDQGDVTKVENLPGQDFSRIEMSKPDGTHGLVFFTMVDRSKAVVPPGIDAGYLDGKSVINFFIDRMALGLMLKWDDLESLSGKQLPISGLQLMSTSGEVFEPAQREALEELFIEARQHWLASKRFANAESQ